MQKPVLAFFVSLFSFFTLNAQLINTVTGNHVQGYSGDGGPATAAELHGPRNLSIDSSGNIFFADYRNNVVREVNSSGIIFTVAGNHVLGYTGDGGPATAAEMHYPTSVITDDSGQMYIADGTNFVIRKVNTAGIITTIAGIGLYNYSGDGGPASAAEMKTPNDLLLYKGSLYFSDFGNARIRVINSSGIISTFAGNGTPGYSGDGGPATDAELFSPDCLAVDKSGNIYIADGENNVVRKVNTLGIITTIAGNGVVGYYGDGGPATAAEFSTTSGLAIDTSGNVYVGDFGNSVVRLVNTSGIITTVAGNVSFGPGYSGDGGPATLAEMNTTQGTALDKSGNLYISDQGNNVIREVTGIILTGSRSLINSGDGITVYPNPSSGIFELGIRNYELGMNYNIEVYNVLGEQVYSKFLISNSSFLIDLSGQSNGIYFYRVIANTGKIIGEGKIIIQK